MPRIKTRRERETGGKDRGGRGGIKDRLIKVWCINEIPQGRSTDIRRYSGLIHRDRVVNILLFRDREISLGLTKVFRISG